jgi:acetyl-CoA carboxylase biotin carboxyl carrier protein
VPLTAQDVAEITRLLEESEFDELHIEHEGLKLTLRRRAAHYAPALLAAAATEAMPAAAPAGPAAAVPRASALRGAKPESRDASPAAADGAQLSVTSPMVGIFYRAPKPGAPPFVDVGSQVEEDTIVGIIEVMKLMNTVRAEVRGRVVEIPVQDGAAVEYGQELLRIAPGAKRG